MSFSSSTGRLLSFEKEKEYDDSDSRTPKSDSVTAFTSYDNPVSTFESGKLSYSIEQDALEGGDHNAKVGKSVSSNAPSTSTRAIVSDTLKKSNTRTGQESTSNSRLGYNFRIDKSTDAMDDEIEERSDKLRIGFDAESDIIEDRAVGNEDEDGEDVDQGTLSGKSMEEFNNLSLESSLFIFGQIVGGIDFGKGAYNCSWEVSCSDNWRAATGITKGTTFTSICQVEDEKCKCVWSHPINFQLVTKSIRGWPQIKLTIRRIDPFTGCDTLAAYGTCTIPMTSGAHSIVVPCWRANDKASFLNDEVVRYHTSLSPELSDERYVVDRSLYPASSVYTIGNGKVQLDFHVVLQEIRFAAGMAMLQISDSMIDTRVKEWLVTAKKKREEREKARRERMVSRMNKDSERGIAQNLASYAMATVKDRRREIESTSVVRQDDSVASKTSLQEERQKRFERVQKRIEQAKESKMKQKDSTQ